MKSNDKDYTHFIDGEVYKNHPFFKENESAIQLQIYFDEFEVCNPLGSRSGVHKIEAFYFTILNFPSYGNSNLNNIHLLALCYNLDIKEFGINSILDVILNDIKILETKGIFIESLNSVEKSTLVSLSFDNLGGAMLLGMNESFSSTNYCRICLLSKTEAHCTYDVENYKLRTSESFKYIARRLHCANSGTLNFFGIKNFSPFCELKNFKICENYSIDVMHDFLEGIGQRDVKLFLSYCIESKLTNLEDINNRIHAFNYGLENRPNKPSSIKLNKSSNGIGQHAAQTLCLISFLPLIMQDLVLKIKKEEFNKWKLISLVLNILKIVLAPKITQRMLKKLPDLMKEYHRILIEEYSVNLTPKDHLALHYPLIISKMGPPKIQWTMRYESKNGFFTSLAEKSKNFKDIAQTLSDRNQKTLLSYWNENLTTFESQPILLNARDQKLNDLMFQDIVVTCFPDINFEEQSIIVGNSINFRGTTLILNKFICTNFINELPAFGKILLFFQINSELFIEYESWETEELLNSCFGYAIKQTHKILIINVLNLPYTKSWELHRFNEDHSVIITNYFL